MDNPLVSIIIPVKNEKTYIRQCLQSLVDQTYRNIEVIVSDGVSVDGTLDIIEEFKPSFGPDRLKLICDTDRGAAEATNKGILVSSGEIWGQLSATDWYEPSAIERVVEHFVECEDSSVVFGKCNYWKFGKIVGCYGSEDVTMEQDLDRGVIAPMPALFFRREVWQTVGLFDTGYIRGDDWEYTLRVAARYNLNRINYVLANFRMHEGQPTHLEAARFRAQVIWKHRGKFWNIWLLIYIIRLMKMGWIIPILKPIWRLLHG